MTTIDHDRTTALTEKLMRSVRQHYVDGPPAHVGVFEALNALAAVTAVVLAGTYHDPGARRFFDDALQQNINDNMGGMQ